MRADARRNRERVLRAAREAFAAEGMGVPLDEIARRAGVGAGTVHRHFPTKEALFEAVVADHLGELLGYARAALEKDDPAAAFYGFLAEMIGQADAKLDLTDALAAAGVGMSEPTRAVAAELRAAFAVLLERGQRAGVVRDDVEAGDVTPIVLGALAADRHRADPERPGRLALLVCDCLRPKT